VFLSDISLFNKTPTDKWLFNQPTPVHLVVLLSVVLFVIIIISLHTPPFEQGTNSKLFIWVLTYLEQLKEISLSFIKKK